MHISLLFIAFLPLLPLTSSTPPHPRRTAPNLYPGATIRCYSDGPDLSAGQSPSQPSVADCYEVGRQMPWDRDPTTTTTFTHSPQNPDTYRVPDSWSYGTCSIGIDLVNGQVVGRTTWQKLGEVAMQVLRTCVESGLKTRTGGTGMVGFGSGMQVSVRGVDIAKKAVGVGTQNLNFASEFLWAGS